MPETKDPVPPLVATAARGRFLRVALGAAFAIVVLVVASLGAISFVGEPARARAQAFAAIFVESAVNGTDLYRRSLAPPARVDDVEQARAWMVADYRVVRCKATRLVPLPRPSRRHECVVRFANGGFVHLDVADENGDIRVDAFVPSPPPDVAGR